MTTLLAIGKAAERIGVSVDTVRKLENAGELKSVRTAGGHRRFSVAVLDAWLARQGARTRTRRAPAMRTARRDRTRVPRDEPPADEWEEPEPLRQARPVPPPSKSLHEQLLDDLRQRNEELAERNRLANLRSYGESLIPYGATPSARSAVIEDLDGYVTARRFPPSTDTWDARRAIEARVEAILEPYKEAAARKAAEKAEEEARDAAERQDEQRRESLVEHGKSRAYFATSRWDREDREEARAEVEEALDNEVEPDWTERDVEDLVAEILDQWEEEDA